MCLEGSYGPCERLYLCVSWAYRTLESASQVAGWHRWIYNSSYRETRGNLFAVLSSSEEFISPHSSPEHNNLIPSICYPCHLLTIVTASHPEDKLATFLRGLLVGSPPPVYTMACGQLVSSPLFRPLSPSLPDGLSARLSITSCSQH